MQSDEGWSSVPNWVIRSDKLHGAEKWVYITLLNRANSKGECWPSLSTLQKEIGVSKNTVLKTLRALEDKRLIVRVQRRVSSTEFASNLYRVNVWQGGSISEPPSSNENQGVVQPVNHPSSNENQEVLPIEVLPIRSTTHIPFENVWASWPKKTEKDRSEAEYVKALKIHPGVVDDIRRFGDAYLATTEKQFIPSLAAWLRRKRWMDDLPEATRGRQPAPTMVERTMAIAAGMTFGGKELSQ